ncbi:methyltransferase domain-containing protein [Pseudanabaena sp. BC1403]|uniref:class I SAM-dependent methyltransferase n=1 Tax=Pseudanabaena sp. BC1403 TaxID=2043171 RepID=UPI000CD9368D|nr:methyltransferase domain-containing protein [Pseudanabaena sp. BC1403]
MHQDLKLLNIGCGSAFHPTWINIDLVAASPAVQAYDIRKNLPYISNYFDACYSSHMIEHLTLQEAHQVIAEAFRVLKPQGIFRVIVPDLEVITKKYLYALEQVKSGDLQAESSYDWMLLELYDQAVRTFSGGEMGSYLDNCNIKNKDFVMSRIGSAAENYWQSKEISKQKSVWDKLKSKNLAWLFQKFRIAIARTLVILVAGKEAHNAFDEGLFRNTGEVHRWMYDRFSLQRMLTQVGFVDIHCCQANESKILDFNTYELDVFDGLVKRPDSLFMEGIKP